jgi:hypothetical protein
MRASEPLSCPIAVRFLEIRSTAAGHRDYTTRSLAFASAALCHCMLFGKSAPPRFDGTMWSTTYPGRLWCEFGSEPDSMGLALWMESGSGYAARAACQISGIVAVSPPSLLM